MLLPIRNEMTRPFQASKWLSLPLLIDLKEMQNLVRNLEPFSIFIVSSPVTQDKAQLNYQDFLNCYGEYLQQLKQGQVHDLNSQMRSTFSSAWSADLEALYAFKLTDGRLMVKVERPVIQLQHHKFDYSSDDGKFRSMVFGKDSISWGIQFSYPQIYQDANMNIRNLAEMKDIPNTKLFRQLQKWVRENTIATPFLVEGKKINVPIRIGKECLPWINTHPQLVSRGIKVFS